MTTLRHLDDKKGFTLVEVAIVLVIIGLLLGGIIKGQALIHQARVKKLETMAEEIRTAVGAYYRSQGQLPGDTDNDGWINNVSTDRSNAFKDLSDLNLITGTDQAVRKHPWGEVSLAYNGTYKKNFIVFFTVPSDVITALDTKYDDGSGASGAVRSSGNTLYLPL